MEFKFIAVNGDNVGDSIGSAIATDNHEELSKITGGLKDAHGAIEQWIESVGGEIVTSSGDEGIYKVPSQSFDETTINSLREQYSLSTGTTITVGIGDSMSEASKALIYGKLNDKDQVVEYDTHIDDYIAGHDLDEEPVEDQEIDEDGYTSQEAMGDQEYEDESAGAPSEDPEYQEQIPEMEETAVGGEGASTETDEALPEEGMEAGFSAEGDETLAEEGEMSEDDLDVAPEDRLQEVVGQDIDGDGDPDAMPPSEEDIEFAAEGEEGLPEGALPEEGMEGLPEEGMEGLPAEAGGDVLGEEGAAAMPEEGLPEEGMEGLPEEGLPEEGNQGALTDMIHANMGGEEGSPEEGEADDEELRQDIVTSLQTFKENKQMLEQAKQENPKLYEATILMLRSMIEMAKKLSMDPEADVEAQMAQEGLPEAAMAGEEEEIPEEEVSQPEDEAVESQKDSDSAQELQEVEEEANENEKKKPFGKSEMVSLYSDLMKGTALLQRAEHQYIQREEKDKKKKVRDARGAKKIRGKRTANSKRNTGKKLGDAGLSEVERRMNVGKQVTTKKK